MLRPQNTKINMISPDPPVAYSLGEEIGRSIKVSVRCDKAKAEVSVRFGSWGRSWEVVRENFLEARVPFKESKKEGGKEGEAGVLYTEETVHST